MPTDADARVHAALVEALVAAAQASGRPGRFLAEAGEALVTLLTVAVRAMQPPDTAALLEAAMRRAFPAALREAALDLGEAGPDEAGAAAGAGQPWPTVPSADRPGEYR